LREQVDELKRREPEVRQDVPDGVHQMRVASRRLRSALSTFRPLLDTDGYARLGEELRWLAGLLGEARDAEVIHQRLRAAIMALPAELVHGPVMARIDRELLGAYQGAVARSVTAMDSQRYARLLDDLDNVVADPPWTPMADKPAQATLPSLMWRDWKRLRRRVLAAHHVANPIERRDRLHLARKAAKRARYTAETLVPVYSENAQLLAIAAKRLQSLLGEHHDGAVTQEVLRRLASQAHEQAEDTFTYGPLYAHEQAVVAEAEAGFAREWKRVSRTKLRRLLA